MPMPIQSGLKMEYWMYAFCTTANVLNRLPTKALQGHISYSLLYKRVLYFELVRSFG